MNLAERCGYWARSRGSSVALIDNGRTVSWRELHERISRIAAGLSAHDIGAGDRVGVVAANSVPWCELALAVLHCGGVVVPLNVRLAPPELQSIVTHADCSAVAYDRALAPLYQAATSNGPAPLRIGLEDDVDADVWIRDLVTREPMSVLDRADSDMAVLGYTSGTTGLPKGAVLTHGNLAAHVLQAALATGLTHTRKTLLSLPLAFTGGLINVLISSIGAGGTLVMGGTRFDAGHALEVLIRERITAWWAVPVMWRALTEADGFDSADLSWLRLGVCGGAPVERDVLLKLQTKGIAVCHSYGLTEATGSVSMLPAHLAHRGETVGCPNVHTEIRLTDPSGNPVAYGEVGEILVRGPQVMAGYWRDPEATAEAISAGWLHTGDLGRWTADDLLLIVDRTKNMFISGGLNVYPAEVERVVDELPGVVDCIALGHADERWGEQCAVVIHGDAPPNKEEVIAFCRARLADYKVPRTVIYADQPLPRSMSGKILRKEVHDLYG
jgi:fatty-acyl-CoA synthase